MMKSPLIRTTILFLLTGGLFLLNSCESSKNNQKRILLTNRQDSTKYYVYHIEYPDSAVVKSVADTLQQFAKAQKKAFMANLPSDTSQYNVTPYQLLVQFKRAFQTPQAVSYIANVYKFTGGAHGRSIIKTFNYDLKNGQFITLRGLFRDTTVLKPISEVAKQKVIKKYYRFDQQPGLSPFGKKWVDKGAAPIIKNYHLFYFVGGNGQAATRIGIIFSPYQVGPHSIGIPKVFIPDSVFYDDLNPKYKLLFMNR